MNVSTLMCSGGLRLLTFFCGYFESIGVKIRMTRNEMVTKAMYSMTCLSWLMYLV